LFRLRHPIIESFGLVERDAVFALHAVEGRRYFRDERIPSTFKVNVILRHTNSPTPPVDSPRPRSD
jgi:hypothetical protein